MGSYRAAALDYIRFVLEQTGMSPSALAKKANVSSTTLTRPLNDDTHESAISISTLDKIREATGYEAGPFFSKDLGAVDRSIDFEKSAEQYHPEDAEERSWTPAIGAVHAGMWLDRQFLTMEFGAIHLVLADPEMQKNAFALVVRDASLSRIADIGDALFCERINGNLPPVIGSLVVVERWNRDAGIVEVTARRLHADPTGKRWLSFDSVDDRFADILNLPTGDDGEEVKIVGEVLHVIRNPLDQTTIDINRRAFPK